MCSIEVMLRDVKVILRDVWCAGDGKGCVLRW
jgi:hypothetical protein